MKIEKNVFKVYENFTAAVITAKGIDNSGTAVDIHEMLRDLEELVKVTWDAQSIETIPDLKLWHGRAAIKNMLLDIINGRKIPSVNKLSDLCNFLSLKHMVPINAVDQKKVKGELVFGLDNNELVCHDDSTILTRKDDYHTNIKAAVTNKTKNALIILEFLSNDKVKNVLEEYTALVKIFCGGTISKVVLNSKTPEF